MPSSSSSGAIFSMASPALGNLLHGYRPPPFDLQHEGKRHIWAPQNLDCSRIPCGARFQQGVNLRARSIDRPENGLDMRPRPVSPGYRRRQCGNEAFRQINDRVEKRDRARHGIVGHATQLSRFRTGHKTRPDALGYATGRRQFGDRKGDQGRDRLRLPLFLGCLGEPNGGEGVRITPVRGGSPPAATPPLEA